MGMTHFEAELISYASLKAEPIKMCQNVGQWLLCVNMKDVITIDSVPYRDHMGHVSSHQALVALERMIRYRAIHAPFFK